MSRSSRFFCLAFGLLVYSAGEGRALAQGRDLAPMFPFVLPWDDQLPSVAAATPPLDKPAGRDGFVLVKDGHLYVGAKRLRMLGVNVAFGANFPKHDDAAKVAARMAKFGINAVRFHHMDMQSAPGGIFAADGRTLDPGQLDRLDYFIAQLKDQGIYTDLNLHVSRSYPGLPRGEGVPNFHKGVDQFFAASIDSQRVYARELLTHRNPFTGNRYVDEPAVALIEINNENALIHEWWGGGLDHLPELFDKDLARLWNQWLTMRYRDFGALKKAWGARDLPLGNEILQNNDFRGGLAGWLLEEHQGAKASSDTSEPGAAGGRALRITVEKPGAADWHVQLNQSNLKIRSAETYTVKFSAKADKARRVELNARQAHAPWQILWAVSVPLTTEWQTFHFTFNPSDNDPDGRLTFSGLGAQTGTTWFSDVSFRTGGVVTGVAEKDRPGNVATLSKHDYGSRTEGAQRDWIRFLWDLEDRYWTGMSRFLKDDLKARGLIVGTQMGWSPFPIQAKLDVVDSHSYWQHPHFPGKAWDSEQWTVANIPMTAAADGGTLPHLGLSRVAGKPFLCTEYNHAAPNTYSAEAFPLLAAYAALQDWDGIFAFAYSHRHDDWDAKKITSFFDIDQHPAKMATLPAAFAMFVRGDVHTPSPPRVGVASLEDVMEKVRRGGPYVGANSFGVEYKDAIREPVAVALKGAEGAGRTAAARPTEELRWADGVVTVDAARSKAVIGAFRSGQHVTLGEITIAEGPTRQDWGTLTLTAVDGPDFHSPGRILITAAGETGNTAMRWKTPARTSVGRDWGSAPSVVEGLSSAIELPVASDRVRVWALDDRGQRKANVPTKSVAGKTILEIGPRFKTLWYEAEIR